MEDQHNVETRDDRSRRDTGERRRRWYLASELGPAWHRGREAASSLSAAAWGRWALTLLIGYALTWVVVWVVVRLGRYGVEHGLQAWDERWLRAFADSWFAYPDGLWFEAWGSSAFLLPMLVIAVVLLLLRHRPLEAATLVIAYLSIKGLVFGAWQLWDRPRPEMIADGIASPGLHSYPSGHAVNSVVLFGLLGVFWWRASRSGFERFLMIVLVAAVVGLTTAGRVRLGTHWPSDIAAGLVIGGAWLAALTTAVVLGHRTARHHAAGCDERSPRSTSRGTGGERSSASVTTPRSGSGSRGT